MFACSSVLGLDMDSLGHGCPLCPNPALNASVRRTAHELPQSRLAAEAEHRKWCSTCLARAALWRGAIGMALFESALVSWLS